ncbi:MAG: hypothetical protein IKV88_05225 [Clostridia bacterium]|nr:hypothetical protein [Clostridia bacterium]
MKTKTKVVLSFIFMFLSLVLIIAVSLLVESEIINPQYSPACIIICVVLAIISAFYFGKIDYDTSIYRCRNCGNEFNPTLKAYMLSSHTINSRRLKCPECGEKSWCIRTYN